LASKEISLVLQQESSITVKSNISRPDNHLGAAHAERIKRMSTPRFHDSDFESGYLETLLAAADGDDAAIALNRNGSGRLEPGNQPGAVVGELLVQLAVIRQPGHPEDRCVAV
jgi:hypothetical protein